MMPLPLTEEQTAKTVKSFQSAATLSSGRFASDTTVECAWSYKNIDLNAAASLTTFHTLSGDTLKPSGFPPLAKASASLSVHCRRGCCQALVKKSTPEKGEPATEHLEIIGTNKPLLSVPLVDICGDVVKAGSLLSAAGFNADCSYFAFAANRRKPKNTSFFKEKPPAKKAEDLKDDDSTIGYEFDRETDWGEGLPIARSIIVLVDVATGKAFAASGLSSAYTWAQVEWHPSDPTKFLVVGFPNEDQRQGLLHYNTRRSHLYLAQVAQTPGENDDGAKLTVTASAASLDFACHNVLYPRFNRDGSAFVFLTTDNVLFHVSAPKLAVGRVSLNPFSVQSSQIVVDKVEEPETTSDFCGLWPRPVIQAPQIWIDNENVVFSSQERVKSILVIINIATGKVSRVGPPPSAPEYASLDLLDISGDKLLVRVESPVEPATVIIAKVSKDSAGVVQVSWPAVVDPVASPSPLPKVIQDALGASLVKIITLNKFLDVILLAPKTIDEKTRLILYPHGGPHSAFSTAFSGMNAYLLSLGYALAMVNFRGSSGYGQKGIESLPGHCGDYDVADCIAASDAVFAAIPSLRRENEVVMGGSHGGFLTLWLIAKYPDRFKAAVARNPVANVAHMVSTTDIPDWCAVETGVAWDIHGVSSAEDYKIMYEASPVSQIHKVKTPLMLCLGDADRRVPMSQSLDYYRILKARGVKSRCIVYPGNGHGLTERVDTESNQWANLALWLAQ
ncbi:hypothetical protein HDU96_004340 [Phlyctochytrium bullatum]|nr:hypothetical protein HDU96_004340 [Phlyctochytrium bullatum]